MITAISIYAAVFVLFIAAFAIRTPEQDVRLVAVLAAIWPVSLIILIAFSILWAIKWDMDVASKSNPKRFQIRYPDDGHPGVAVTVFHTEVQIWKKRNV